MKKLAGIVIAMGMLWHVSAQADEWAESQMYVGLNGGIASYTNLPASSSFSMGFDFGTFSASGFGVGGFVTLLDTLGTSKVTTLGGEIAYQFRKKWLAIRLGGRVGALINSSGGASAASLLVGPVAGASILVTDVVSLGVSVGWATTTKSPAITRIDPRIELRYVL